MSRKKDVLSNIKLIGRREELARLRACLKAGRNVLLEGPVGVGKTHLALAVTEELKRPVFRVDGDGRYSEQKLSGWFDPPIALKHGYGPKSFIPGPLTEAMKQGAVLFINELNRLPEAVQNVLLPAIDERKISIPKLGSISAKPGFTVLATQNPKEFVATSHLSEAILDRFDLVVIDYQQQEEEEEIVRANLRGFRSQQLHSTLAEKAVSLIRLTRSHSSIKRGASVRAAIATAQLAAIFSEETNDLEEAFLKAALMALPTRIEVERELADEEGEIESLEQIIKKLMYGMKSKNNSLEKKKSR